MLNPDIQLKSGKSAPKIYNDLGLTWIPETNKIVIEQNMVHKLKLDWKTSQRKLFCFVTSIFDLLRIVVPFTRRPRKNLQSARNSGPKDDKPLRLDEKSDF